MPTLLCRSFQEILHFVPTHSAKTWEIDLLVSGVLDAPDDYAGYRPMPTITGIEVTGMRVAEWDNSTTEITAPHLLDWVESLINRWYWFPSNTILNSFFEGQLENLVLDQLEGE